MRKRKGAITQDNLPYKIQRLEFFKADFAARGDREGAKWAEHLLSELNRTLASQGVR